VDASVRRKQKRLQRLSKTVPANNRILQAVRQGIPDRWTSHTESPSAIAAELVVRTDVSVNVMHGIYKELMTDITVSCSMCELVT